MKETIPNAFTIDEVCRGNNTIEEKGGLNISYFSKRGGVGVQCVTSVSGGRATNLSYL